MLFGSVKAQRCYLIAPKLGGICVQTRSAETCTTQSLVLSSHKVDGVIWCYCDLLLDTQAIDSTLQTRVREDLRGLSPGGI